MNTTKVFYYCSRLHELGNKTITKKLKALGAEGLVSSHGDILMKLYLNPQGLTMSQIATSIHRSKPTVTILVGKLCDKGYAVMQDDPEDGRQVRVILTKKALDLKPKFDEISNDLYKLLNLDADEIIFLEHLLKKALNKN